MESCSHIEVETELQLFNTPSIFDWIRDHLAQEEDWVGELY
jgi:hypothetical protein